MKTKTAIKNLFKSKYCIKKFDGDDSYSWAVFKKSDVNGLGSIIFYGQAKPICCGLDRQMAIYYKDRFDKEDLGKEINVNKR